LAASVLGGSLAFGAPSETEIRVRLKRHSDSIDVTGMDVRISPPSAFFEVEPRPGFHRAKIVRRPSGTWVIHWDHERKPVKIHTERLWVRGQMLRIGIEPAPYDLELMKNPQLPGIDVIARLDLENYLQGVLPAEMPVSWPLEALKAQAVSARSFVLRQAFERRNRDFDVEATILDQVYKFIDQTKMHPEWAGKLHQAIAETRGEILLDDQMRVLKAFFSADCGCQSEDPKFVWGKSDSFQSVKDPTCASRRPMHWTFNMDRAEVRNKLLAALDLPENSNLRALQVGGRTPSGRVANVIASIEVQGKPQNIALNSQEFRRIFGFEKIQSTDFTLRWNPEQLEVSGIGSGHGVGLCQRGARTLAENGSNYRDILKMYYPKATIR
jgi:stage II sporulation protein D